VTDGTRTVDGVGRRLGARRLAFAVMVLVTGWSIWAWAQPKPAVVHAPQQEAEGEEPAPINWFEFGTETPPFLAMVVNFAILAAGYYLFGKKPIAAALQNRRDSIAKEIEEAQRMRHEAEARAKTYQAKLDRLEEEVRTARDALVRAGEAERERIVSDAEAKAERLHKDAQFLVEQEMKQIRQDLWRDTLDVAVAAAEELLKRGVTQADQDRLAEDYLADLGGKARGERGAEQSRSVEPGAGSPS
jgi:F-type H+-transporting ATPase subunit b